MVPTLGEIPRPVRIASARRSAAAWRVQAAAQVAPYRRAICMRRARRMDDIADGGFMDKTADRSSPPCAPHSVAGRRAYAPAVTELLDKIKDDDARRAAFPEHEKKTAIELAAAYKKRRRQKDSFEKKMRQLGFEPIGDPTDQTPANWQRNEED